MMTRRGREVSKRALCTDKPSTRRSLARPMSFVARACVPVRRRGFASALMRTAPAGAATGTSTSVDAPGARFATYCTAATRSPMRNTTGAPAADVPLFCTRARIAVRPPTVTRSRSETENAVFFCAASATARSSETTLSARFSSAWRWSGSTRAVNSQAPAVGGVQVSGTTTFCRAATSTVAVATRVLPANKTTPTPVALFSDWLAMVRDKPDLLARDRVPGRGGKADRHQVHHLIAANAFIVRAGLGQSKYSRSAR